MSAPCLSANQTIYESRFIQQDLPPYTPYRTNFKLYPDSVLLIDLELNQLLELKIFIDHSGGRSSFFFGSLTSFDTTYATLMIDCSEFYQNFDEFIVYSISAGSKISIYGVRLVTTNLETVWPDSLPNSIKVPTNITYGIATVELVPHLMCEWQCHKFNMSFFNQYIEITNSSVSWYAIPDSRGMDSIDTYYKILEHCPPGFYPLINESLYSTCASCIDGFVCGKGLATPCSTVGTYASSPLDSECVSSCPAGTYPYITDKGYHMCAPCPIGFACPNHLSLPIKCEGNTYSNATQQTRCQVCEREVVKVGNLNVYCSCEKGYYLIGSRCELCPIGYACNGTNSAPCLNETYTDTTGMTSCGICPVGYLVESLNSIGVACSKCAPSIACNGARAERCVLFYKVDGGECVMDITVVSMMSATFLFLVASIVGMAYLFHWKYSKYLKDPVYRVSFE